MEFLNINETVQSAIRIAKVVAPTAASSPMALSVAAKIGRFAKPAWKFHKATTYWRMGINAGVQTMIEGDAREINYASVAAEILPLSVLSPLVEWRPMSPERHRELKTVFVQDRFSIHYKSISETFFDLATQAATCGISKGVSMGVRGSAASELQDKLIRRLFDNVAFPIYQSGFQLGSQSAAGQIRNDLKLSQSK